ncbi:radical SAM enzyme, Cfr family [Desulfatibacillum aliphaticivorans]|uniref:Probable dual-specificity RNA methyltransferase RlmN n=1 Tax=Desulfatibacillum aliphaticivorans TaxID=218208 RepID=B8FNP8_DESAL|nr:23S rRNA (adenine(2503)-C(2))-methyltransferase RlmN [Desulfatibacillum aliphaticivorans]ACL06329.1 radical SAM enzyme, Cfr family [Desulfatibacillum aliphaticivorans]
MENSSDQTDIISCTHEELVRWLADHKLKPYRAFQILQWVYQRQADSFDVMTNLAKRHRQLLSDHFTIGRLKILQTQDSSDGSRKFLFQCADGASIETVLIPEKGHHTLCVSTQVGCAMGCKFCCTASMGLTRSLQANEIISQIRDVQATMEDPEHLRNLVFMGMGEPLANWDNVKQAMDIITDNDWGLRFSGRRVTISTVGLVPKMAAVGKDTRVKLAVSLNAPDNEIRDQIMPVNKKHPIEELLQACKDFPLRPGRRVTFEYVLLKGVNDSPAHARKLGKLLAHQPCKINLIPYNPHENSPFERPDPEAVDAFYKVLMDKNYTVIVRHSKGLDIKAACGQLKAANQAKKDACAPKTTE